MFEKFRYDATKRAASSLSPSQMRESDHETNLDCKDAKRMRLCRKTDVSVEKNSFEKSKICCGKDGKWQERWHSICKECFTRRTCCTHFQERRLRLLIVGHNPSTHAWITGYSYSNPSNRMWGLLTGNMPPYEWSGIVDKDSDITFQNRMPDTLGIGLTSLGTEPGNDAANYDRATMSKWKHRFYNRLVEHMQSGCECQTTGIEQCKGDEHGENTVVTTRTFCSLPHHPRIIAFSGKRQFSMLFSPPVKKIKHYGCQSCLPPDWPFRNSLSWEVWVLPSSSGRAVMTKEERALPYQQLAKRLKDIPWPLADHYGTLKA